LRKNNRGDVVLYDTDEEITAKIENFKDGPAMLTMIQHIPGQWDMETCNMKYEKKDANTLEFEITLPARTEAGPAVKELKMHYRRRNLRPGAEPRLPVRR
jgi:CelD/BcsL family acetyltransferase involved in cellulose biosynthesis